MTDEELYPLGVLEPQFVHWPANITSFDAAEECIELCESVGLWLDESQQFTLRVGCAERADGTWAAYEMGDAESRQNGKGDTKIARALGGLFLWDEELMLWTAHEFKTANESFIRIEGLIQSSPELLAKVSRFRYANGEQAVELKSGARLKFAARSGSSGRGFAGVSTLFFDEAQHLDPEAVAAASGAMAVAENPQIWLAGSAGLRTSQQWWRMRKRALKGNGGRMLTDEPSTGGRLGWVEHTAEVISIDEKGKLVSVAPDAEDRRNWAAGNAALGRRIGHEFLENQLGLLGPEKFSREHLTVWDPEPDEELGHEPKFPAEHWAATLLNKRLPTVPGQVALAWGVCDVTRRSAIVASAGSLQGPYIEVIEERDGFGWLPARLVELVHDWKPWKVGCDGGGAERSLLPTVLAEFSQADPKIKLDLHHSLTTEEYKAACGGFYTDVVEHRLARATFPVAGGGVIGQHALDDVVAEVGARAMGQGWILDPRTVTVSIAPLKGAVVARSLLPEKPKPVRKARVHSF